MPIYEYRCRDCGDRFEVLQSLGAGKEGLACPRCGAGEPDRQLSTFATGSSTGRRTEAAPSCGTGACCGGFACEN